MQINHDFEEILEIARENFSGKNFEEVIRKLAEAQQINAGLNDQIIQYAQLEAQLNRTIQDQANLIRAQRKMIMTLSADTVQNMALDSLDEIHHENFDFLDDEISDDAVSPNDIPVPPKYLN